MDYLYLLIDTNTDIPFYIGYTNNPTRRLKEHQADFRLKKRKFKNITSFYLKIIVENNNKKFNLKYVETFIILYDKLFTKILNNQFIY